MKNNTSTGNLIEPPIQLFGVCFWCRSGATGMERMDFVYLMDNSWYSPSRGWTEISPIYTVFPFPVQFEVRRSIH